MHNPNHFLKLPAADGRYFDPVKRHYYRTEHLFITAPECGDPIPNQVIPKQGRYFDSWERHYYKIPHLFGIDNKCHCKRRFGQCLHRNPADVARLQLQLQLDNPEFNDIHSFGHNTPQSQQTILY